MKIAFEFLLFIFTDRKNWTVHGIWPTKPGKKGPFDCDHSKPYNHGLIEPILPNLRLHWTNVRANTDEDNFWKHEWNKHGTCAMVLEPMNNEFKYFSKGNENTFLTNFNEKNQLIFLVKPKWQTVKQDTTVEFSRLLNS